MLLKGQLVVCKVLVVWCGVASLVGSGGGGSVAEKRGKTYCSFLGVCVCVC